MIEPAGIKTADLNAQESEINQLSSFNLQGKTKKDLMEAAKQFEGVFMNQLFQTMDSTIQRGEMFHGGRGEEIFRSMFYQELSSNISTNPDTSFGFAKQIYEQMKDLVKE